MHPQDTKCTPSQSKSQFLGQCTPTDKILATPMSKAIGRADDYSADDCLHHVFGPRHAAVSAVYGGARAVDLPARSFELAPPGVAPPLPY